MELDADAAPDTWDAPEALGDAAGGGDGRWLETLDAPLHSSDAAGVAGEVVNHHRLPRKRET